MDIPFTVDQFFGVFRQYNDAIWPAQWVLHLLALTAIMLAIRGAQHDGRTVTWILATMWLWAGIMYHLTFFAQINRAALLFAAAFVAQGALFVVLGVRRERLTFRPRADATGFAGAALIGYALVAYPILGHALGHRYPASPTFGVPCPTTIFTFGLLLWAAPPVPRAILVVPGLWAIVGTLAALGLGVLEDLGLTVAAVLAIALTRRRGRRQEAAPGVTVGPTGPSHARSRPRTASRIVG